MLNALIHCLLFLLLLVGSLLSINWSLLCEVSPLSAWKTCLCCSTESLLCDLGIGFIYPAWEYCALWNCSLIAFCISGNLSAIITPWFGFLSLLWPWFDIIRPSHFIFSILNYSHSFQLFSFWIVFWLIYSFLSSNSLILFQMWLMCFLTCFVFFFQHLHILYLDIPLSCSSELPDHSWELSVACSFFWFCI